ILIKEFCVPLLLSMNEASIPGGASTNPSMGFSQMISLLQYLQIVSKAAYPSLKVSIDILS
ncbi:hypothetical protein, partial [Lactococcus petauri]|uniref:hypothetical protein n=1 Tax=Lactococcus petauri TaxID=1940789 RepID=UPI0021F23B80